MSTRRQTKKSSGKGNEKQTRFQGERKYVRGVK